MFQELFSKSKTIGFCVENSKLRVIHPSLIFDAVKEGKDTYLSEVLSALEEKYKKEKSRVKLMMSWLSSKLGCGKTEDNLDRLEQDKNKDGTKGMDANLEENKDNLNKENPQDTEESLEDDKNSDEEKEADDTLVACLQELEDAHVQFAKNTANASNHEDVRKELQDMKDRVGDLKNAVVTEDPEKETPLWDAVNEEGDTCLHIRKARQLFTMPAVTEQLTRRRVSSRREPNLFSTRTTRHQH